MSDLKPLALARDFCSLATPYRLLQRVAGLAFNFSSVTVETREAVDEPVAEKPRQSGIRPAFRAT